MMSVEERYMCDAEFHALVTSMVKMILDYQVTPSEMREAAMFACVKAEIVRPHSSIAALQAACIDAAKEKHKVNKDKD